MPQFHHHQHHQQTKSHLPPRRTKRKRIPRKKRKKTQRKTTEMTKVGQHQPATAAVTTTVVVVVVKQMPAKRTMNLQLKEKINHLRKAVPLSPRKRMTSQKEQQVKVSFYCDCLLLSLTAIANQNCSSHWKSKMFSSWKGAFLVNLAILERL